MLGVGALGHERVHRSRPCGHDLGQSPGDGSLITVQGRFGRWSRFSEIAPRLARPAMDELCREQLRDLDRLARPIGGTPGWPWMGLPKWSVPQTTEVGPVFGTELGEAGRREHAQGGGSLRVGPVEPHDLGLFRS